MEGRDQVLGADALSHALQTVTTDLLGRASETFMNQVSVEHITSAACAGTCEPTSWNTGPSCCNSTMESSSMTKRKKEINEERKKKKYQPLTHFFLLLLLLLLRL